jgi:peptidoglycan/LPS O-acetylase OafA/YrhL
MSLSSRRDGVPLLVASAAWAALLLDVVGRRLDDSRLWIAGAHTTFSAFALGCLCLLFWRRLLAGQRWSGLALWLFGLVLLGLARLLRGAAGVAPDPPLIAAVGAAALLLSWVVCR